MILPIDTDVLADLDRVGAIIDRDGIAAVPHHLLLAIADDAKQLGIRRVAAEVLIGHDDPDVARERAFSKVACSLIGASRQPLTA